MKNSLAFCWIVKYYRFDVVVEDVVVVSWTARERFVLDPNLGLFAPMNKQWLIWAEQGERQTGLANNYFLLRRAPGLGLSRCEIFDDHGDYLD